MYQIFVVFIIIILLNIYHVNANGSNDAVCMKYLDVDIGSSDDWVIKHNPVFISPYTGDLFDQMLNTT